MFVLLLAVTIIMWDYLCWLLFRADGGLQHEFLFVRRLLPSSANVFFAGTNPLLRSSQASPETGHSLVCLLSVPYPPFIEPVCLVPPHVSVTHFKVPAVTTATTVAATRPIYTLPTTLAGLKSHGPPVMIPHALCVFQRPHYCGWEIFNGSSMGFSSMLSVTLLPVTSAFVPFFWLLFLIVDLFQIL